MRPWRPIKLLLATLGAAVGSWVWFWRVYGDPMEPQHHPLCFQSIGVPQSLLDAGAPPNLCDCKTLDMLDRWKGEKYEQT